MSTVVGVDGIHLVAPIGRRVDDDSWQRRRGRRWTSVVEVGGATVTLWSGNGGDSLLYVGADFNPSRVLDDDPLYVCELERVPETAERVWAEVVSRTDAVDDWRVARVQQLDLTRDFQVHDAVGVIQALNHVSRPRVKQHLLYHDPLTTRPTGLKLATSRDRCVGGGRRGQAVTLYDKGAELGRPDLQVIRWEARCRAWTRQIGKITYGFDMTDALIEDLAKKRWEWSGAGAIMAGELTMITAVKSLGLSPVETEAVIGHALLRSAGEAVPLSKTTRLSREKRLRELGIVVAAGNPYPRGSFLDFTLGREVAVPDPDPAANDPATSVV
ncbi:MAG: hypothetical protein WEE66_12800 [Actinomycetota bacterium]